MSMNTFESYKMRSNHDVIEATFTQSCKWINTVGLS